MGHDQWELALLLRDLRLANHQAKHDRLPTSNTPQGSLAKCCIEVAYFDGDGFYFFIWFM